MAIYLEIHHLDVGQGECTVVLCKQDEEITCTVIDGGRTTRGGETLLRFLSALGIKAIDNIICTHTDTDHIEGLTFILGTRLCEETRVFYNDAENNDTKALEFTKAAGDRIRIIDEGNRIWLVREAARNELKEPFIRCLRADSSGMDPNNRSVASLICFNQFRYFTAGDLRSSYEDELFPRREHVCAAKAGHHGSRKSTSETLLQRTTPSAVFISCGIHSYCHPDQEVIDRIHEAASVKRMYLTGCYYDRAFVNPGHPESTGTLKAKVAGDTDHLGSIVIHVDEAGALNHRFRVVYWDNTARAARYDLLSCNGSQSLDQPPVSRAATALRNAIHIRSLAGLDVKRGGGAAWENEIRDNHQHAPFSLETKPPSEEGEERSIPARDHRYMAGTIYREALPKKRKREAATCAQCGHSFSHFDEPLWRQCTGCRETFSVHAKCKGSFTQCTGCQRPSSEEEEEGEDSSAVISSTKRRRKSPDCERSGPPVDGEEKGKPSSS